MAAGQQNQVTPVLAEPPTVAPAGYRVNPLLPHAGLPLEIQPAVPCTLNRVTEDLLAHVLAALPHVGCVLLRGFAVSTPLEFKQFAARFGRPLLNYEFGSTPRTRVFQGVYTSTEYPAHQHIPLHNEQSYTRPWPSHIWFHCVKPSHSGGETPIGDSREVFRRLPAALREEFIARELLYVRNYGSGLDLPWQQVFGTDDRRAVERYCAQHGIEWEWRADGELSTRQRCQAAVQHPATREWVWFNQAHLFHVSGLEPPLRASLLQSVGEGGLPRNVYFGDGAPIPDALLDQVRAAYDAVTVTFPWRAGDVLMLDNLLVAHGRRPFGGERKVIVAMA